jgi:prolyl 4-hydroxylase
VAGNRVVSVLVYLGCAAEGGETQFTSLGLRVTPTPCAALLWHNFDRKGVLDRRTLHCGRPVLAGEKWGMNIWFRQRPLTPLQAGAERPPAPWTVQPPTQTMPSRAAIESTSLRERCG